MRDVCVLSSVEKVGGINKRIGLFIFLCCECKIDCMMIERERDEIVD